MNPTWQQAKEQADRIRKNAEQSFAADAPKVHEYVKKLSAPLEFDDVVIIYGALYRKQITLEMLPDDVLEEFKKTRQYKKLSRSK